MIECVKHSLLGYKKVCSEYVYVNLGLLEF